MKTCPNCGSLAFEDMDTCYDCYYCFASVLEELPALGQDAANLARMKVVIQDLYAYDTLLRKHEGAALAIGGSSEDAIVVPDAGTQQRQCTIFFSQGQIWAEAEGGSTDVLFGTKPLSGAQAISPGDSLHFGSATITLIEA